MLTGYTVPLSPLGIANLATKPPWDVSLFAGRTILSGRGDELVELARENLL